MSTAPSRLKTRAMLEGRVVRFAELRPCRNAFIDCRTPGSEAKENFTIIGPGVSENPDQYVHIAEPHGYNIGGARQPPGCVNSQHSHNTAEVFVVHSGRWRFTFGETGTDASVDAEPGDVVSFPTKAFRGFTNIGRDQGFLWSVLGGDDPGRVTWAPQVFDMARDYGLVLLEGGSLIDTAAGQTIPEGARAMPRTRAQEVAAMQQIRPSDVSSMIARNDEIRGSGETLIIGNGGRLEAAAGFTLTRFELQPGGRLDRSNTDPKEVLFVHRGSVTIRASDDALQLGTGDTVSIPAHPSVVVEAIDQTTLFRVQEA